jgi:hypothetical protein
MTDLTYDPTHVYTAEEIAARRAAFDAAVQQDTAQRAASLLDVSGRPIYSGAGVDVYTLPDIAVKTGPPWSLLLAGGLLLWLLLDNDKRGGGRGDF